MKQCCRNCHFLAKSVWILAEDASVAWSRSERDTGRLSSGWFRARCAKGVWMATPQEPLDAILDLERKGCYFMEVQEGMKFATAVDLEVRDREDLKWKRSHRLSVIGLWIAIVAAIAAVAGVVVAIVTANSV